MDPGKLMISIKMKVAHQQDHSGITDFLVPSLDAWSHPSKGSEAQKDPE
jgi:hypothetical protein